MTLRQNLPSYSHELHDDYNVKCISIQFLFTMRLKISTSVKCFLLLMQLSYSLLQFFPHKEIIELSLYIILYSFILLIPQVLRIGSSIFEFLTELILYSQFTHIKINISCIIFKKKIVWQMMHIHIPLLSHITKLPYWDFMLFCSTL